MSRRILHAPIPRPDSRVPSDENPVSPCMRSPSDQRVPAHFLSTPQRSHMQLIGKRFCGHGLFAMAIFMAFVVHLGVYSASGLQCFENAQVAAVVLAHSRPGALRTTLKSLKEALISSSGLKSEVALYISIDSNPRAARVQNAAELEGINVSCIWHNLADRRHSPREKISAHYAYAFEKVFHHTRTSHEYAILLEDDLEFAPDFILFITAFLPHLSRDKNDGIRTVCISGWNDNGASPARCHPSRVSRTTYFPGLGWALSRGFWKSALQKLWPGIGTESIVGTGWDYWMRTQFDAHGWNCITPEVPRVFHFGSDGTNVGADEKATRFDDSKLASVDAGNINWTKFAGKLFFEDARCLFRVVSNAVQVHGLDDPTICDLEWDCESSSPGSSDCDPAKMHFVMLYNREVYAQDIAGLPALRLLPLPRGHFMYTLTLHMTRGRVLHVIDKRRSEMLAQDLRPRLPDLAIISPASDGQSCTRHCGALGRATGNAYECSVSGLEYVNTCSALRSRFPCTQCMYETGSDLPAYVVPAAKGILQTAGTCLVTETGFGSDGRLDCDGAFKWTRRLCVCDVKGPSSLQLENRDEL